MEVTLNFTPSDSAVVTGGGGWVHPKCKNSMAMSGVDLGLVGGGWAMSLVLRLLGTDDVIRTIKHTTR